MQGFMYTADFKAVAVTAQQDFFELRAPTNQSVIIHGWLLSQNTELADAAEEQLLLTTNRGSGSVTSGSGGNTATAVPLVRTGPSLASGGAVEINNTTKLAVGTGTLTTDLEVHNWNIRVPYHMVYTPEMRPVVIGTDYWTLELETTPADSITISGTLWFEVLG